MTPAPLELSAQELESLIERVREKRLLDEDYPKLEALGTTIAYLSQVVNDKSVSIQRLLKMLFGAKTEKTEKVTGKGKATEKDKPQKAKKKKPGHGRNGTPKYTGAEKVLVSHELTHKDSCPLCSTGKIYLEKNPKSLIRVTGGAPLNAVIYEMERLRCNLCGEVFTAATPEGVGEEKYDAGAGAMIALLKYGNGFPFYRLENLQNSLGMPVPSSTQWDIVRDMYLQINPFFWELINQGAAGNILHNDDTTIKILSLINEQAERTGMFTTGIVSIHDHYKIALFYTGRNHAGENITQLLKQRDPKLKPPIQMCDALSRNRPKEFETILANCLSHGRRRFVDIHDNFPDECGYILHAIGQVYKIDAEAKDRKLTADERLRLHQNRSGPIMVDLEQWMNTQFDERHVEPNSGLGQAIRYMLRHWPELTLFLREPGAPLDNNICERALKKAILNRKNAMFYKTLRGAEVGDLFMSLIHTCELNNVNPFEYLVALKENVSHAEAAANWMPWNYKTALDALKI